MFTMYVTIVGWWRLPWQYYIMMSADIFSWWLFLCTVSGLNIFAWSLSAFALERRGAVLSPEAYASRRLQLLLSAGFALGCAFRSVFPVYDVPRIGLFDSWLSSVIVGRSVATFAELCFAAQWALLLREFSCATGSSVGKTTAALIVPLIAIAETFSWYSVLTTSNLGHVAEESIWGLCAVLLVASLVSILPRCESSQQPLLAAGCMAGLAYAAFMFLIDVPMYWSRWIADDATGRLYLSLAQGLRDVSERWVISHRWQDWQSEMVWMSLYFSVGVWVSISLISVPVPERDTSARLRHRTAPFIAVESLD